MATGWLGGWAIGWQRDQRGDAFVCECVSVKTNYTICVIRTHAVRTAHLYRFALASLSISHIWADIVLSVSFVGRVYVPGRYINRSNGARSRNMHTASCQPVCAADSLVDTLRTAAVAAVGTCLAIFYRDLSV